ncbi:MAG: RluA family pseudouridine synthase [Candidatus Levybacteria bacterium]|nr:RluA family pseudouridine synthase [Candidatus Levybacteria bacterium]
MQEPKIIFEDEDIMVVDKPSGMTVNRSDTTTGERTLQDWVEEYLGVSRVPPVRQAQGKQVSQGEKNRDLFPRGTSDILDTRDTFRDRAGIVHRLDKETSGIILVAKTPNAFTNLQAQFKERRVKKVYIALAHGEIKIEEGEIRVPVGRLPWNKKQFGVVAGGRDAITKYKILNIKYKISDRGKEPLTLLELYPETGRTHQIRVHLKYFGHPIFGDFLYGGRKQARNDRKVLPRVFLHAAKISFTHPQTGETLFFESSLSDNLEKFLQTLSH